MSPEARCHADRACLEGSESRDRLSGGSPHAAGLLLSQHVGREVPDMNRPTCSARCSWMLPAAILMVGVGARAAAQAGPPAQRGGQGGEPPWVTDRTTGCTASLRDTELDPRRYSARDVLTWTGACKNGKLDGYGTLTIWNDSIPSESSSVSRFVSRMEITPESGLRMNDGVVSVSLEPSELRIEVA